MTNQYGVRPTDLADPLKEKKMNPQEQTVRSKSPAEDVPAG